MSIVSTYRLDPGRHIIETHTDHLGNMYTQTFFAPNDWTAQQIQDVVDAHGLQIAENLADGEVDEMIR